MLQPGLSLSLPTFTLPGLLPPSTCVVLDQRTGTAIVLHLDASSAVPLVGACQLRPSAAKLFLALLQAYPQACSHQHLFLMLYGGQEEERVPVWDPASGLKAIHRALFWLSSALRSIGLEAVALRGHGYLLAAAASATSATVSGASIRGTQGSPRA